MSLRHPGGLNNMGDKRGRLADASWGEVIAHPSVILVSSIIVFAITFAVLAWRDGTIGRFFIAKGATIDTSSRSWMGSATGSRAPAAPQIVVPSDSDLKRAQTAAQDAARQAKAAEESASAEAGAAEEVSAE